MNHNGVLTTGEELYEHNYEAYETFREEGTYRMKLDFRSWWNKGSNYGLICYFSDPTDSEVKKKGFCFRHFADGEEKYTPSDKKVAFEKEQDGTLWDVTISKTKKGKYAFAAAQRVS